MNKLQWAVIILSGIAFSLFFGLGIHLPFTHVFNLFIYFLVLIALSIFVYLALKVRHCGNCQAKLPRIRKPATTEQALYGGMTCPKCGEELDSSGTPVKK